MIASSTPAIASHCADPTLVILAVGILCTAVGLYFGYIIADNGDQFWRSHEDIKDRAIIARHKARSRASLKGWATRRKRL